MNVDPPERVGAAATAHELEAAVRQAIEQSLTDAATAGRAASEHTAARLWQIDRQLEVIGRRLAPPPRAREHRIQVGVNSLLRSALGMTVLLSAIVVLAALATLGSKLISDRAYASGVSGGYARAAIYERNHPAQWRAYQRAILSAERGESFRVRRS